MFVAKTVFEGLLLIQSDVYKDDRGYFLESFNKREFDKKTGTNIEFLQDNVSYSVKNVIRGLHFQKPPFTQTKLVRVLKGTVLDVAVDLRKNYATYGKVFTITLNDGDGTSILIPKGFAHGFSVLSDEAVFAYKCDLLYHKDSERGIKYDDLDLHIDWKLNGLQIVSKKDMELPPLADIPSYF